MAGQIVFDCEGPITLNDNALELCQFFIPNGGRFFTQVSRYDDFLADIERKPGYKAGDTLKLVSPFLKVFGGSNQGLRDYSKNHLSLLPDAEAMLAYLAGRAPVFIISTSYESYIRALCDHLKFPFEQTYCTLLDLDKYSLSPDDERQIKSWTEEIIDLPVIELPSSASSLEELSEETKRSISRLDQIFWEELPHISAQRILDEVDPVGGEEKARALKKSLERTGLSLEQVMYIGDSITDVQVFKLVREGGGLTVSFNGNRYALQEADIACLSGTSLVVSVLADVFLKQGRAGVIGLVGEWDMVRLTHSEIDPVLLGEIGRRLLGRLPKVELIDEDNRERLVRESEVFRTQVRGEAGRLG